MENRIYKLTPQEKIAVQNYIKNDDLRPDLKWLVNFILFMNTEAKDKSCYAHNAFFAKKMDKSERTIRRDLKTLKDIEYITIEIIRNGKYIVGRIIHISQSLIKKAINIAKKASQKVMTKKAHKKASGQPYGLSSIVSEDIKEKKDLLLRNKSQKEKVSKRSRPENYDEVFKLWSDKNLEGTARAFWRYNTKRAWADIRNWKRAAIGWARKAKDNLAAFKANKAKDKQTTTNYNSILPDLSYNNWDIL